MTRSFLERCSAIEDRVRAWAALDPDLAIEQARAVDRDGREKPLAGVPFGVKDIFDDGGLRHRIRQPDLQGLPAARRRRLRRAGPRCRRRHSGQDDVDRVRRKQSDGDAKSARPEPDARRLVERFRGGRRSVDDAGGDRHANRRIGYPAGLLLRRRRLQADFRLFPARRTKTIGKLVRHPGIFRPQCGRRGRVFVTFERPATVSQARGSGRRAAVRSVQDRGMVCRGKPVLSRYSRSSPMSCARPARMLPISPSLSASTAWPTPNGRSWPMKRPGR